MAAGQRADGASTPRWVMLGSGERRYEDAWQAFAAAASRSCIDVRIGFDERLSHLIEAGADMFLMPSRFEPCGLNQMYSLRYGTVPLVRATGGLGDTVEDVDVAPNTGTGFTFRDYTPGALVRTVQRALEAFRAPDRWAGNRPAGHAERPFLGRFGQGIRSSCTEQC